MAATLTPPPEIKAPPTNGASPANGAVAAPPEVGTPRTNGAVAAGPAVREAPWPPPVDEEKPATITASVAATFAAFGLIATLFAGLLLGANFRLFRLPGLAAGGAGAGTAAGSVAATFDVVATEFKFTPAAFRMDGPGELTINLDNKGVVEHDFTIEGVRGKVYARAGAKASGTFTLPKTGNYVVFCSIPGHREAGMVATLTVGSEAAAAAAPAPASTSRTAVTLQPAVQGARPLPAPQMAPPVNRSAPAMVKYEIETQEVTAQLADGVTYNFWTFNGTVPGPMLRVRQGDTVELTLKNAATSKVTHSIDLHAVTGPGGGAKVTQVAPGESATFIFQATNPGVYVYHCATPMVAHHIANGMYGLIVVEPPGGLPAVDREFYVMQGDFYVQGERTQQGHQEFSMEKMLDERADFVLFNGGVGAVTGANALKANVGETVRIFFGVGGPNLTSSFHVIGEIFDRVYTEGASQYVTNVQTTHVPAGGATIVDFKVEVPGSYILVDHSLSRLEKGSAGILEVEGPENPAIFQVVKAGGSGSGGH